MDKKLCNSSQDPEVRKGPWTMEEDLILINYIANHGEGVWNSLAKAAGLKRTGKSCRLRWLNYLRPDVRRGNITPEEQLLIMELHAKLGNRYEREKAKREMMFELNHNLPEACIEKFDLMTLESPRCKAKASFPCTKGNSPSYVYLNNGRFIGVSPAYITFILSHGTWWSKIAKHLPGRTDNEIKNYWRTRIQKHIKQSENFQQQSSEINDHQTSTSQISTMADPMETYSPPSYQGTLEPFSTQFPTIADQSSCCTNDNNYWSVDDIWSMQLLNGD